MKKRICSFVAAVLCFAFLSGCVAPAGKNKANGTLDATNVSNPDSAGKTSLKIVTTIFPIYDFVRQITSGSGAAIELTLLQKDGSDPHHFAPTAEDIKKIISCDLFISAGGDLDSWISNGITSKMPANRHMSLMDICKDSLLEKRGISVAQQDEKNKGAAGNDNKLGENNKAQKIYDEHVWLSLEKASYICNAIAEKLIELDPKNKKVYLNNITDLTIQLYELNEEFKIAGNKLRGKSLIVADRFPFIYLFEDLKLGYYAAFPNCAAETEAGDGTIRSLAAQIDELDASAIFTLEKSKQKIAHAAIEKSKNQNCRILELDSMQLVSQEDIDKKVTYISIMKKNLKTLESLYN